MTTSPTPPPARLLSLDADRGAVMILLACNGYARAPLPQAASLDGVSLAPLLANPIAPLARDTLHWHLPHYHHTSPASAIRRGDWKLIEFFEDNSVQLFNLRTDPGEETDLAAREPVRARELQAALAEWRKHVGARMPEPNPNHDPARAGELAKGKNKKDEN